MVRRSGELPGAPQRMDSSAGPWHGPSDANGELGPSPGWLITWSPLPPSRSHALGQGRSLHTPSLSRRISDKQNSRSRPSTDHRVEPELVPDARHGSGELFPAGLGGPPEL